MSELEIPIRDDHQDDDDWERRVLCPDEVCIGTVGDDGRCRMCGTESPDGPPPAAAVAATQEPGDDDDALSAGDETDEAVVTEPGEIDSEDEGDEWDRRELCPDEMCVGTLDPLGRCSMCGATR